MVDKLSIANEMAQLDCKNREFYDELSTEEKKKFSLFLMLRYSSSVSTTNSDLQKYYILSTNQQVNKHFWSLNKHPKLQWLLFTCVSPGMGNHRHEWIGFKGKQTKNPKTKLILKIYPMMKTSDAELLSKVLSDNELKRMLLDYGWQESEITKELKSK
jgi:hypothetical protein